jgi:hypothetical protein
VVRYHRAVLFPIHKKIFLTARLTFFWDYSIMKQDLIEYRKGWERGLTTKSVLDFEHKTVVILHDEQKDTYNVHRYFLMGGEWACSMDEQMVTLDEVFGLLEYIVK